MTRRFFVEPPLVAGDCALPEAEAVHLASVLRARPGDEIELADGAGREAEAVVVSVGKRAVLVRTIVPVRLAPKPAPVELWAALPRAGAADDVVRQAVEAGATLVRPLLTERGVWRPDADGDERRRERFRRAAIAALKQCKASWLPELPPPARVADLVLGASECALFGSLSPEARPAKDALPALASAPRVIVLTGPEGGFTSAEEAALVAAGARPVRLGERVMRAETAVVALLAVVALARG